VARSKVVEPELHAELPELMDDTRDALRLIDEAGLGDLQVDLICRSAVPGHELLQAPGDVSFLKLARGKIHVDANVRNTLALPRRCVAQRTFHRPRVEAEEIGSFFRSNGQWYPAANLSPWPPRPQERLGAYDLSRFCLVNRLIEENQLLLIEGAPDAGPRSTFSHS